MLARVLSAGGAEARSSGTRTSAQTHQARRPHGAVLGAVDHSTATLADLTPMPFLLCNIKNRM